MIELRVVCLLVVCGILSVCTASLQGHAEGFQIKQVIKVSVQGKEVVTNNEWMVQNDKFRLTTKTGSNSTQYLFTGTLFYICGKLSVQQIKQIEAKSVNPEIIEDLKKGTCQEVPSNFMVRFFLSPITSIETVDLSDGLKLTLGVLDFQIQKGKQGGLSKIVGVDCESMKRNYTIQKARAESDKELFQAQIKATEDLCVAPSLLWRGGLWREVRKAVLRQPGGAALIAPLQKDFSQAPGIVLKGQIEQEVSYAGKSVQKMTLAVHTTSQKNLALPPDTFRLPAGYKVFNPEKASNVMASSAVKASPGDKPKDQKSFVDFLHSAVFCGLAQGICVQ